MSDLVRDAIASGLAALTPAATTPTASGYGIDLVCFDDIDPRMAETDPADLASLAQDCYHRITTTRGTIPDAPDFGVNVIEFLHRGTTPQELAAMGGQCESEIAKDDRVDAVTVTLDVGIAAKSLAITVDVTPVDTAIGPFTLIVSVTDGAALLKEIQSS